MLDKKNKKTLIFLVVFFIIMVFSLFAGNMHVEENDELLNETVISLFDSVKDNYTISVNVTRNDVDNKYTYYTDSKLELYEINDDEGYIKYNDNYYSVDSENYELTKIKEIDIYDKYSNINLIKNLLSYCDYSFVNKANIKCKIKISDYIDEYNKLYSKEIPSIEGDMIININHLDKLLNYIEIDYSDINKLIDNNDDKLKYKIVFEEIGNNDFSDLMELYKDELK